MKSPIPKKRPMLSSPRPKMNPKKMGADNPGYDTRVMKDTPTDKKTVMAAKGKRKAGK